MRRLIICFVLTVAVSGCSIGAAKEANDERRGRSDAPVAVVDDTPKDVIQAPDRFSNVATMCDLHGFRIFVTTKSDNSRQLAVVPDPKCTKPDHAGHMITSGTSGESGGSTQ